ncbi:hypothetical protein B0H10DRAFT_2099088 [Mycena sp. CBHHK59/15]|nr:hypothetical protein B0H10DRAFT_2099088 [Mycena sp. CBHHK59/15]
MCPRAQLWGRSEENSATSPSTAVSTRRQICLRPRLRLDAPHTSADRLPCGLVGTVTGPRISISCWWSGPTAF